MKILLCHTTYQQPGGEDAAFEAECRLLAQHGHEVIRYTRSNDEIAGMRPLAAAATAIWSRRTRREVGQLLDAHRPDVMHCHNTFVVMSPSIYAAANGRGVPVVKTLHNFRLLCAAATLYRGTGVCRLCEHKRFPWPALRYACYRGSRRATASVALMLMTHRLLGTWSRRVDAFVTLTQFAKGIIEGAAVPAGKTTVIPNFAEADPTVEAEGRDSYALYVGRLSAEKGVDVLADAWCDLPDVPLKIAGDGPLANRARCLAQQHGHVEFLGWQPRAAVRQLLREARYVVVPSVCYEGFPMAVAESMAAGTPLVAARIGGLAEIVVDGEHGFHFEPGNPLDLARVISKAWQDGGAETLGQNCRKTHQARYSPEAHLEALTALYSRVIQARQA